MLQGGQVEVLLTPLLVNMQTLYVGLRSPNESSTLFDTRL